MQKIFLSLWILLAGIAAKAQNVGINIATPEAALDIYGDVIFRSADMVVANGTTLALDVNYNRFSFYRLSGPTANFTIAGITQGVEGRLLTLFNRSGFAMQLNNLDAAADVGNRIITGTNANLVIDNRGIVNLMYDGAEQKWVVLSNNKATGGAISGGWGLLGNTGNTTANFIGNTDNVPLLLKSNNATMAQLDAAKNNLFLGQNSGVNADVAAAGTISIGQAAGYGANGTGNIYMGYAAGYFHRNGSNNILIGNNNDLYGSVNDNFSNSVSIGDNVYVYESNKIKIGNSNHNTGIGLLFNQSPDHTLVVGKRRQSGPDPNTGAMAILGGQFTSHFNYGNTEDTYIRGGKLLSKVYVNEQNGGDVILGSPTTSLVGIGIAAPEYKLHIRTPGENLMKLDGLNSLVVFHDRNSNVQYGFLRAWTEAPFNTYGHYGLEIGVPPAAGGENPKRLMFSTNYAVRMTIMESGSIGIGTDNPGIYKLAVNGSIRAKELRINTGWADYVFDKNYQLKPLAEVEQFIKANKHLPGIEPAAVLQKEGVDVSAMQTKMMAKIEELTLYLIDANKKIEKLQKALLKQKR